MIRGIPNFMYKKIPEGMEIFELDENLDISMKPLAKISNSEIKQAEMLPTMYYPCISKDAPAEIKAAYVALKDGYGKFIEESQGIVGLYDEGKELLCHLRILMGRRTRLNLI